MLYPLIKPLLFSLPAETSHDVTMSSLKLMDCCHLNSLVVPKVKDCPVEVMGLTFPNPVGLAAGLDKNADYLDALAALGFGFLEVGTVTPRAQPGNPKPRLFRLPEQQAIINRMGFNNKGVDHLVERVRNAKYKGVLGINIGKNFDTPVEKALDDYIICMDKVYEWASYITVNISSPNTPGLRDLQFGDALNQLLAGIKQQQTQLADTHGRYVPLAVKVAPDMGKDNTASIADALIKHKIDAVIATNTTISRTAIEGHPLEKEPGGLSGKPVQEPSNKLIQRLSSLLQGEIPIIGVGGILSGADASTKIDAGAQLVQIYSGLIFSGPDLVKDAVDSIRKNPALQNA